MKKLTVEIPGREYEIYIEAGLLECAEVYLEAFVKGKKVCILSDTNVFPLYGEKVSEKVKAAGGLPFEIVVKAGEESKSFEALEHVCRSIIENDFTRSDVLVALGGGVVGDLGGLCASVVLRGVKLVQIPTTLLAQVDSSVGGKTAINIPEGKNLIGTFYQPSLVLIDTNTQKTLPAREVACGMAEVIKYAAIRDGALGDKLARGGFDMEDAVFSCCAIKARIVKNDERDTGERMLLNFGHTIGHAAENSLGYGTISHGAAVAIGMCAITKWAEKEGLSKSGTHEYIKRLCVKYNLPTEEDMPENLIYAMRHDKKRSGGDVNLVIVSEMGKSFTKKMPVEKMGDVLKKMGE